MRITVTCAGCGNEVMLPESRSSGFCGQCGAALEACVQDSNQGSVNKDLTNLPDSPDETAVKQIKPDTRYKWDATVTGYPVSITVDRPLSAVRNTPDLRLKKLLVRYITAVFIISAVFGLSASGGSSYQKAETKFLNSLLQKTESFSDTGMLDFFLTYEPSEYVKQNAYIPDLSLEGMLNYTNGIAAAELLFSSDGNTAEIMLTHIKDKLTISLPELTRYYLLMKTGTNAAADVDFAKLDRNELKATLGNFIFDYFKHTKGIVSVSRNARLTCGNKVIRCTAYTLEFTEETVSAIGLSLIDALRSNDNLISFLNGYASSAGGEPDYFMQLLDGAEKGLLNMTGDNTIFRMTVWADGDDIIGRKIEEVSDGGIILAYQFFAKNNKAGFNAEFRSDSSTVSLSGDFTQKNGAWDGIAGLTMTDSGYNGEIISAEVKCTGIKRSSTQIVGEMEFHSVFEGSAFNFLITFDGQEGNQYLRFESCADSIGEGIDIGVIIVAYTFKNYGDINLPELDETMGVWTEEYSEENGLRAQIMADELYANLKSGNYDDNGFMYEMLYSLWSMVDDIAWYSIYSLDN